MSSIFMLFVYFCYIRTPFKLAMLNWMLLNKYLNNNNKKDILIFRLNQQGVSKVTGSEQNTLILLASTV